MHLMVSLIRFRLFKSIGNFRHSTTVAAITTEPNAVDNKTNSPVNPVKMVHPAIVERINPFLKPIPAWLRDFRDFKPLSITRASAQAFNAPTRIDIMHRVVHWYRAGLRAGTASSKHRSDVRGSTRKIYQQKGTGRARAGTSRAPHRRGGATCFGPKPRQWAYSLPLKLRNLGLRSALSSKFRQGELTFVTDESIELPTHKTKALSLMRGQISAKTILVLHATDSSLLKNLISASKQLHPSLTIMNVKRDNPNVYHILKSRMVVLTEGAKTYYENYFDQLKY